MSPSGHGGFAPYRRNTQNVPATLPAIKTKGPRYRSFYWQTGYAAHSVSPTQLEAVDRYVANQEAHHTRMTFQEELRIIRRKKGIELDY